jgi:hypothetical protein
VGGVGVGNAAVSSLPVDGDVAEGLQATHQIGGCPVA